MNRIGYGLIALMVAVGLLSACTGGKIELEGDSAGAICFTDEQCAEGSKCTDGECVASGDITVSEDVALDVAILDVQDVEGEVELIECIPGEEVCDGIDNDCDGEIDEELGTTTCGVGECEVTVDNCVEGLEQECLAGDPTDEICDGLDNDCNGDVDDELGTTTCGVGECEVTVANCVEGEVQDCVPAEASEETCDGLDNDCDGDVDNGLGTITCGLGICEVTVDACLDGTVQECLAGEGGVESCDGLDNDCNGETDELLGTTTCGIGECEVTVDNCLEGVVQDCVPAEAGVEVCDGKDNDCDGDSDEELGTTTCGVGECEVTVENCVAGDEITCIPLPAKDEECDSLDNDCDGDIDEELGTTTCGLGICEVTVDNCLSGVVQTCVPGQSEAEVCDGQDNDCDGDTDEELGSTTCGIGACVVTVDNCLEGMVQSCIPGAPVEEVCDTVDNDCDGDVDNMGFAECGIGACYNVVPVCADGELQECVPGQASNESCDYIDNDCNGVIDDPQVCQTIVIFGRTYQASGGQPVVGAKVTLKAAGDCSLADDGGPALLVLSTNEKGGYSIDGFAGSYCLEATADGYQKMISEDFTLVDGDTWVVNFPMALDQEGAFVGLCGRVADADTLVPLDGASVLLGAVLPGNVVGSTQTDGDGLYCMGGVAYSAANDWYAAATYPDYIASAMGPFQFEMNVVKFVSFLLDKDTELEDCHSDDFELDTGWVATDPVLGAYWHHRTNDVTLNAAVPACVTLAEEEQCVPDAGDPNDSCAICLEGETNNCIPQPGALPNSYDGTTALWFGVPGQGNYGGELICAEKNGGNGGPTSGTYTSPAFEMVPTSSNLMVSFWYWYEIEGVDPNSNFERMSILVSANGTDFTEIGVLNPEIDTNGNSDQAYTSAGFFKAPTWAWTAMPLGVDLTAAVAASGEMHVRFSFNTTDSMYNGFRGWLVDGMKIRGVDCRAMGAVEGLVYDADQGKAPVADATVTVKAAGDCDGMGPGGDALFTTTTGANGYYIIELPPGEYCIEVVSEGYAKMVTEDLVVEQDETQKVDFGLQPGNVADGYVALCGRVADAETLALLPGASVSLAATLPTNVVASAQTNSNGFFCIGGVLLANADDWFALGAKEGYLSKLEGPLAFEANKVKFVTLLLAKDNTTLCLSEGFEQDNGWVADSASFGSVWQRFQSQTLMNQAVVNGCVSLSVQENCTPNPADPNDPCPICKPGQGACVPVPGALTLPYDGQFAAWFGNPNQGNFLSTGGLCSQGSGGEGETVTGDFTSPQISIPANAEELRLTFAYWYEIEGVDPNSDFDRMEVHLSTNGTDFTQVALLNPSVDTDGQSDEAYTSGGFLQAPTWNVFDLPLPSELTTAATQAGGLWVRFRFNSGDGAYNAFRGWMVDNVSVRGNGCD
jgi:hypothetical protein